MCIRDSNNNNNNQTINIPHPHITTTPKYNILSLNINGATTNKQTMLNNICDKNNIDIIILIETHDNDERQLLKDNDNWIWSSNNFENEHAKRGVAIACRRQLTTSLSVVYADGDGRQLFVLWKDKTDNELLLAALYFPAESVAARVAFMRNQLNFNLLRQTYAIGADTNMTMSTAERWPARAPRRDALLFDQLLVEAALIDVGAASTSTPLFTFRHRNGTNAATLDRLLVSNKFSAGVVRFDVLAFPLSDHDAVFAQFADDGDGARLPARTQTLMLEDDVCLLEVRNVVAQHQRCRDETTAAARFDGLLSHISTIINRYSKKTFIARRRSIIKRLKKQERTVLVQLNNNNTPHRQAVLNQTMAAIQQMRVSVNAIAKADIRRRLEKAEHADDVDVRRLVNAYHNYNNKPIRVVNVGNNIISSDIQDIEYIHQETWRAQLNRKVDTMRAAQWRARNSVLYTVTKSDAAAAFDSDLNRADLLNAVNAMQATAPGADRCDVRLFQKVPELLDELVCIWKHRRQHGLPAQWTEAWVKLLFKGGNECDPTRYRPIALLCVAYKIVTKALQLKLRHLLNDIVSPLNRAFLPGRRIEQALHSVVGVLGDAQAWNKPLIVCGLDIKAAYDSLSHEYLFEVLRRYGFNDKFIDDVRLMHSGLSARIIINGKLQSPLPVTAGVRQGCALSVLLYVLALSPLFNFLSTNGVGGYCPSQEKNHIIGAAYVDDHYVFCKSQDDVEKLWRLLDVFYLASGQRADPHKTHYWCVGGARLSSPFVAKLVPRDGCVRVLGVWLNGAGVVADKTWLEVRDDIEKRVRRWQTLRLTLIERARVARVHVLSRAGFVAAVVPCPPPVAKQIDNLVLRVFVGRCFYPGNQQIALQSAIGGITKNGIGTMSQIATSHLAMTAVRHFREHTPHHTNDWLWKKASRFVFVRRPCIGEPPFVSGPTTAAAKASNNPAAWAWAALAHCRLITTPDDRSTAVVPLFAPWVAIELSEFVRDESPNELAARIVVDDLSACGTYYAGISKRDADRWRAARVLVAFDNVSARVLRWRLQYLNVDLKTRLIVNAHLPHLLSMDVLSLSQKSFLWRLATASLHGMRSDCPACPSTKAPNQHVVTSCERARQTFGHLRLWFFRHTTRATPHQRHHYSPSQLWELDWSGCVSSAHDTALLLLFVIAKQALYTSLLAKVHDHRVALKSSQQIATDSITALHSKANHAIKLDREQHRQSPYTNNRWYKVLSMNINDINDDIPSLIFLQQRLNAMV